VEKVGIDLFRLRVAYSFSLGTEKNYENMVSRLADNFADGLWALEKRFLQHNGGL